MHIIHPHLHAAKTVDAVCLKTSARVASISEGQGVCTVPPKGHKLCP